MGAMASTTANFSQTLYNVWVDEIAQEYALAMNPGSMLIGGFDRAKYDEDHATFLKYVDTPAKLMQVVAAHWNEVG
jgi:hypothetical protein